MFVFSVCVFVCVFNMYLNTDRKETLYCFVFICLFSLNATSEKIGNVVFSDSHEKCESV